MYQIRVALNTSSVSTYTVINNITNDLASLPSDTPIAVFEERIRAALPESEANSVLTDLNTLSFISQGPDVTSFDYWSMLDQLFSTVKDFCHRGHIFRLRGFGATQGKRLLKLSETAIALFDHETKQNWVRVRYEDNYAAKGTGGVDLYLIEGDSRPELPYGVNGDRFLPILANVMAKYIQYDHGGYGGGPPVHETPLSVMVLPGSDIHWLAFVSAKDSTPCEIGCQRMLTGKDVLKIVNALKNDLQEYIDDLSEDQAFSERVLRPSLNDLLSRIPTEE
jgi:hypothetical protein